MKLSKCTKGSVVVCTLPHKIGRVGMIEGLGGLNALKQVIISVQWADTMKVSNIHPEMLEPFKD